MKNLPVVNVCASPRPRLARARKVASSANTSWYRALCFRSMLTTCLLLTACPRPICIGTNCPSPDAGTGGTVATGGTSSTGGTLATGGMVQTGGSLATGGQTVAIQWPPCSNTFKAGPVVKHKLGRVYAPRRYRKVQPWHSVGIVVRSVLWAPNIDPLDQGNLGSCTGNAVAGELSTQPFLRKLTEKDAVSIYSLATKIDPFAGQYPPTDTGSDGPSALTAAVQLGFIIGWTPADMLADMHAAIQTRPGIFGSNWTSDMFSPDRCGQIHPTGAIEGGHEYEYLGFDKESGKEWFRNSWGDWGPLHGYFWMNSSDVQTLIDDGGQGDFANVP
jgi:hypothetical protein